MSTAAIPLRCRADLQFVSAEVRGESCQTVCDPIASRYYQLHEVEAFILRQLEAPIGWQELERRVSDRFAPRRVARRELEAFVALLHREGLLASSGEGQAEWLLQRSRQHASQSRWSRWSNPLAIRFRGLNPAPWLHALLPRIAWLVSAPFAAAAGLLVLATALFALLHLPEVAAALPSSREWLTTNQLLGMGVALGLMKVLHELGHAVVCHRVGGQCRELGVMLLVGVPCLYCDVTDVWLVRDKWRRIAVSGAGIAVELLLASLGFWLWWCSDPGWLHSVSLSVAVIGSVNTVLFNGNPLLRYDGYYMLADYWETPNLFQRSRRRLAAALWKCVTPSGESRPDRPAPDHLLLPYGLASVAYQLFVLAVIWWALWSALRPWGLEVLAHWCLAMVGARLAGPAVMGALRRAREGGSSGPGRGFRPARAALISSAAALIAGSLLAWQMPHGVTAVAVVQPHGAASVRALAGGTLAWAQPLGTRVEAGETVARLEDAELQRELLAAEVAFDLVRRRQDALRELGANAPELEGEADIVARQVTAARQRLESLRQDAMLLEVKAPQSGLLWPARSPHRPDVAVHDAKASSRLDLLATENRGIAVEANDELAVIGEPGELELLAVVGQHDIALARVGQAVTIAAHSGVAARRGRVVEISEVDLERPPAELTAARLLAGQVGSDGSIEAIETWFAVRISLEDPESLLLGGLADVCIHTRHRSLWQRMRRWTATNFSGFSN
ncbi:MAG: hypothetical protein KDB14_05590 [Planctomycetales bacterium]|nr:hypothetical protein [Planctomycetales bacterium]